MKNYKILFDVKETTQILFGPCKPKGSEYMRTMRMIKSGEIESIMDRTRHYVKREFLVNLFGSDDALNKQLQNLNINVFLNNFEIKKWNIKPTKTNKLKNKKNNEIRNLEKKTETSVLSKTSMLESQKNWFKKAIKQKSIFDNKDFNNKDLALYCNVASETISRWRNGARLPELEHIPQILNFFECDSFDQLWIHGLNERSSSPIFLDDKIELEKKIELFKNWILQDSKDIKKVEIILTKKY